MIGLEIPFLLQQTKDRESSYMKLCIDEAIQVEDIKDDFKDRLSVQGNMGYLMYLTQECFEMTTYVQNPLV